MSSSETVKSLLEKALRNPPPDDFDQNMQEHNENHPKRSKRKKRRRGRKLAKPVTPPPAVREELDYEGPEWNIIEDKALLDAVRNEEAMGHTFEKTKKSLRYNWEYISAFVNRVTRFYRSPRQCSLRYQLVVRPRETGQMMVVDPLTKKPRKVELTPAEVAHQSEGRVSTDLQYAHDADRLREASYTGRLQLIKGLAAKQNKFKENRRPIDPQWLQPSGRLPAAQERRFSALGVRYDSTVCPGDIIKNLEEKRLEQEAAKKKLTEQQASNERSSPPPHPVSVCVRPPAVPAGPDLVKSSLPKKIAVPQLAQQHPRHLQPLMGQIKSMGVPSQPHFPAGGLRRVATYAQAGVPLAGHLIQTGAPNAQHSYVVSQDSLQPASRMQFVTRAFDGVAMGQASQPVYYSMADSRQSKQIPPSTSSLGRMQEGYMAYLQKGPGNRTTFQSGNAAVGGPQWERLTHLPTSLRLIIHHDPQDAGLPYFMSQQQIGMGPMQRSPPQQFMRQNLPMTTEMLPTRSGPHQIHAVPRGFTPQSSRILNAGMTPNNILASISPQSLPMQSSGQLGGATLMTSGAPRVRRHSPFSEATGVSPKRQHLSRPLAPGSENSFPQTTAQVASAQPSQLQTQPIQQQQQQQQQEQQQLPAEEQHPLVAALSSITLFE